MTLKHTLSSLRSWFPSAVLQPPAVLTTQVITQRTLCHAISLNDENCYAERDKTVSFEAIRRVCWLNSGCFLEIPLLFSVAHE